MNDYCLALNIDLRPIENSRDRSMLTFNIHFREGVDFDDVLVKHLMPYFTKFITEYYHLPFKVTVDSLKRDFNTNVVQGSILITLCP